MASWQYKFDVMQNGCPDCSEKTLRNMALRVKNTRGGKIIFSARTPKKPCKLAWNHDLPKSVLHGMTLFVLRHDSFCHAMGKCLKLSSALECDRRGIHEAIANVAYNFVL